MDALENGYYTSVDFRNAAGVTSSNNWQPMSANSNSIYYVNPTVSSSANNVISGTVCSNLVLSGQGMDFQVPFNFTANTASYSRTFNGYDVLILPFQANIPSGVTAYLISPDAGNINCTAISNGIIPANTPVIINATGNITFNGSGNVSTPKAITVNQMNGIYQSIKVPANAYVLKTENGVTGFYKVTAGSEPAIGSFKAYLTEENAYSANVLPLNFGSLSTRNISAEARKEGIKIYPNPVKADLFIDSDLSEAAATIFDARGSVIRTGLKINSGKTKLI